MRVFLSKPFTQDFTSESNQKRFIDDFKDWHLEGRPCSYLRFGRCWTTKIPIGHDFDHLWHMHLAPTSELVPWNLKLNSRSENVRCDRKSDNLLFFVEYKGDFLIMKRSNHALMQPPMDQLNGLCMLGDNWVRAITRK